MRRFARSGSSDDARAARAPARSVKAAEAEEHGGGARRRRRPSTRVLTPGQQVKYRIFEAEVEHRIREAMARMRAQRRDGGRFRGDAPPDERARRRPDPRRRARRSRGGAYILFAHGSVACPPQGDEEDRSPSKKSRSAKPKPRSGARRAAGQGASSRGSGEGARPARWRARCARSAPGSPRARRRRCRPCARRRCRRRRS